jgi:hypothetical protein
MDDRKVSKHPSYGMVQFNRISGSKRRLFGSTVSDHSNTILLRISQGERVFDLKEDRYYSGNKAIIEVELSSAQFAGLLTTMNIGSGVPCTIRRVNNESVEPPPEEGNEMDRVREGFKEDLKNIGAKLAGAKQALSAILAKKSIGKGDKESISKLVSSMFMHFEANVPFVQEQFQRATDRSVANAKAEIDCTITDAVTKLGLKTLGQLQQLAEAEAEGDDTTPLELSSPD